LCLSKSNINLEKILINNNILLTSIIKGIQDVKGEEISVFDLRKIENSVCDFFVICSGTSSTNVKAIANSVQLETSETANESPWNSEGKVNAEWVLLDYGGIVVHIFTKETREYYALEDLWADAEISVISELVE